MNDRGEYFSLESGTQGVSLLNRPLHWFGHQNETTYRDIFAVFGFRLPWHGAMFTIYGHNEKVVHPEDGQKAQIKGILENAPFITLHICGAHAQFFLGKYNGTPIMLDQHGYGYKDDEENMLEVRCCCVSCQTMPTYFLKRNVGTDDKVLRLITGIVMKNLCLYSGSRLESIE